MNTSSPKSLLWLTFLLIAGCDSDGGTSSSAAGGAGGANGGTTASTSSSASTSASTASQSASSTGSGTTCKHCSEAVMMGGGPAGLCPASATLFQTLGTCTCDPANCGSVCQQSCTGMGPNDGCGQCQQMIIMGACQAEYQACAADTP